ncbi:hypothetical protein DFQ26_009128 [Actinomortierella ambigua]|nr:hypothetical protein DFQ26_009128 [Actinomortierella ambigua]
MKVGYFYHLYPGVRLYLAGGVLCCTVKFVSPTGQILEPSQVVPGSQHDGGGQRDESYQMTLPNPEATQSIDGNDHRFRSANLSLLSNTSREDSPPCTVPSGDFGNVLPPDLTSPQVAPQPPAGPVASSSASASVPASTQAPTSTPELAPTSPLDSTPPRASHSREVTTATTTPPQPLRLSFSSRSGPSKNSRINSPPYNRPQGARPRTPTPLPPSFSSVDNSQEPTQPFPAETTISSEPSSPYDGPTQALVLDPFANSSDGSSGSSNTSDSQAPPNEHEATQPLGATPELDATPPLQPSSSSLHVQPVQVSPGLIKITQDIFKASQEQELVQSTQELIQSTQELVQATQEADLPAADDASKNVKVVAVAAVATREVDLTGDNSRSKVVVAVATQELELTGDDSNNRVAETQEIGDSTGDDSNSKVAATQDDDDDDGDNERSAAGQGAGRRGGGGSGAERQESLTPQGVPLPAVRRPMLRIPSTPVHVSNDPEPLSAGTSSQVEVIPQTPEAIPSSAPLSLDKSLEVETGIVKSTQEEEKEENRPLETTTVLASSSLPSSLSQQTVVMEGGSLDEFEGDLSLPETDSGESPEGSGSQSKTPSSASSSSSSARLPLDRKSVDNHDEKLLKELGFSSPLTASQVELQQQQQRQRQQGEEGEEEEEEEEEMIAIEQNPSIGSTLASVSQSLTMQLEKSTTFVVSHRLHGLSSLSTSGSSSRGSSKGARPQPASEHDDDDDDDDEMVDMDMAKDRGKPRKGRQGCSPKRAHESESESEGSPDSGRATKSRRRAVSRSSSAKSLSGKQQEQHEQEEPQEQQDPQMRGTPSSSQRVLQRAVSMWVNTSQQQTTSYRRTRSQISLERDSSALSLLSQSTPSSPGGTANPVRMQRHPSTVLEKTDWSRPKVLLSGAVRFDQSAINKLVNLRGVQVNTLEQAQVVLMNDFGNVKKLYHAVLYGIPVLLTKWLTDCKAAKALSEPMVQHYATDPALEEKYGFRMHESVRVARERACDTHRVGFFTGLTFKLLLPAKNHSKFSDDYSALITYEGGLFPKTKPTFEDDKETTVILGMDDKSCPEYKECLKFFNRGYHVVTKEFVLMTILRQRVDLPADFTT